MKTPIIKDRRIINLLNRLLGMEMSAASQFRLHARLARRRGDPGVADRLEEMAGEEDRHAAVLIDLIDASGMRPITRPGAVRWPESPFKILELNRRNEIVSVRSYERLAGKYKDHKEFAALMKRTARAERRHIRMLDRLIERPLKREPA